MKKTSKLFGKILAAALSVTMVGAAAVTLPADMGLGTNVSVSAVTYSSPVVKVGDFQYSLYSDGTAHVVGYTGTKNLSTTSFGMPSVVYAKDVDTTWQYLQYNSSYKVTQMEASIFSGCKFKTLSLPRYLQAVMGGFIGAEIGGFFIDESNSYFSSIYYSGAYGLYNKSGTTLYAYPSNPSLYVSGFGTETKGFPSTLTRIDDQAFANSKLYTVTVPSTVTYMGDRVFYGSNVHYVTFQGDAPTFRFMPSETIPDHGTFEGASGLYQITIKGKNGAYNSDGYGVVYNKDMTKLVLVPQGKTTAFKVPDTCYIIGDYAFYHSNCNGPVLPEQVLSFGSSAFYGVKSNFKAYCYKDTNAETYLKEHNINFGYHFEFEYTSNLNEVIITKYSGPFTSPTVPSKIVNKNVVGIANEAFRNNDSLTAVYMYSPLASIGDYAFYDCDNLKTVSMPSTVTSIGQRAFYSCDKLTNVTLPSKLEKIGTYAFGFCIALNKVTIPNSVTQINTGAFYGCSTLADVTLGTGLKTIGAYAFENTSVPNQYIPKNVTSIGEYAFGFDYVDQNHLFHDLDYYISGYPNSGAQTYANKYQIPFKSVITYSLNSAGSGIIIEKYTGSDKVLVIPDKIDGKPVVGIKGYAFSNSDITSVTLPSSMTTIDGYAFYGAGKLTSVTIPSSITSIGNHAFEFCSSLKSITIPASVTSIGSGAFYGCTALANVYCKEGLKAIGSFAFCNTALSAVSLPSTITSIGEHAFGYKYANSTYTTVTFTMTGYVDTAAETYANNNSHITFKPLYLTFTNTSTINKTTITLGESVTITGSATGGKKPYEYAVYYKKSTASGYTTLQNFSTNATVTFTPSASGSYTILVTASDYRNVTYSKTFTVTVNAPALVNTSTLSASTVTAGDSVILNSKASGGEGSYTYAANVSSNNGGSFTTLRSYSSDPVITFVPEKSGTYILRSYVKDSNGTITSKDLTVTVKAPKLVNTSQISDNNIIVGTPISVLCSATGGEGDYLYEVYYQKTDWQGWNTVQAYSSNNSVSVTLASVGHYVIAINVKDGNGTIDYISYAVTVKYPLYNNSTVSATTIKEGEEVIVSCAGSGGTEDYEYAVQCQPIGDAYEDVQVYDANDTVSVKFETAGSYRIKVIVRDSDWTEESKTFDITVTAAQTALVNNSTIAKTTITLGEKVSVTCAGEGGTAPYVYGVYYKKTTAEKWSTAQSYKDNANVTFKPGSAVTYDVCVKVKDSTGKIEKKYFTVKVTKPLENKSVISAETIKKGETVTVTGKANGGTAPYVYGVYYKKTTAEKWSTAQSYKSNAVVKIKPAAAVTYDICVKVKDTAGKIEKKYFTVTVTK